MSRTHTSPPWSIRHRTNNREGSHFEITAIDGRLRGMAFVYSGEEDARVMATAPELLDDLIEAAKLLRKYEELHRAKGTEESTLKAEVNSGWATRFESTIARATGGEV